MVRMDENMPFLLQYENVAWYENGKVRILDRRIFPEVRFVECTDYHEVAQAITDMVTQSAGPYTAVGMGMALAAWQVKDKTEAVTAYVIKPDGTTKEMSLTIPTMTDDERQIILDGCLINYYRG